MIIINTTKQSDYILNMKDTSTNQQVNVPVNLIKEELERIELFEEIHNCLNDNGYSDTDIRDFVNHYNGTIDKPIYPGLLNYEFKNDWAVCAAMDEDGELFEFETAPTRKERYWDNGRNGQYEYIKTFFDIGNELYNYSTIIFRTNVNKDVITYNDFITGNVWNKNCSEDMQYFSIDLVGINLIPEGMFYRFKPIMEDRDETEMWGEGINDNSYESISLDDKLYDAIQSGEIDWKQTLIKRKQ
jgi:hypothetical protein